MAFALQFAIAAEALCGDYAQIRGQSEALIELSQQHGYPHWLASGKMSLGASIVEEEDFDRGIALMREGMAGTREYGTLPVYRYGLVLMASTFLRAGNVEEGLRAVDEAAEGIEAEERFNEAEIWRLRGEFMLAKRQELTAAENFRRAIGVARAQQGKSWELRATFSLARMLASQDHAAQADAILADSTDPRVRSWRERLQSGSKWDPFAFVDLCEECAEDETTELAMAARRIQYVEMSMLV